MHVTSRGSLTFWITTLSLLASATTHPIGMTSFSGCVRALLFLSFVAGKVCCGLLRNLTSTLRPGVTERNRRHTVEIIEVNLQARIYDDWKI